MELVDALALGSAILSKRKMREFKSLFPHPIWPHAKITKPAYSWFFYI